MAYVKLINGKIIECKDSEVGAYLCENMHAKEISEDDAYILLFIKIGNCLASKFSNYSNLIDISQDIFYMLFKTYKEKGVYAKDKSYYDNCRIWWSIAKKDCYYLIRRYKLKTRDEDLTNFEEFIDSDEPRFTIVAKNDFYEFEHLSTCDSIVSFIEQLAKSTKYSEYQMGIFGMAKLNGLTDKQAAEILEIGMERIYEIRRALKTKIHNKFGDILEC